MLPFPPSLFVLCFLSFAELFVSESLCADVLSILSAFLYAFSFRLSILIPCVVSVVAVLTVFDSMVRISAWLEFLLILIAATGIP